MRQNFTVMVTIEVMARTVLIDKAAPPKKCLIASGFPNDNDGYELQVLFGAYPGLVKLNVEENNEGITGTNFQAPGSEFLFLIC